MILDVYNPGNASIICVTITNAPSSASSLAARTSAVATSSHIHAFSPSCHLIIPTIAAVTHSVIQSPNQSLSPSIVHPHHWPPTHTRDARANRRTQAYKFADSQTRAQTGRQASKQAGRQRGRERQRVTHACLYAWVCVLAHTDRGDPVPKRCNDMVLSALSPSLPQ